MFKKKSLNHNQGIGSLLVIFSFLYKYSYQFWVRYKNSKKKVRRLEIGPGEFRIEDFETLNIFRNNITDYVGDISHGVDFKDNTFDLIYLSHILEHVPWYKLEYVLGELYRVLKPGGNIEIWVPDGYKIAKAFVDAEELKNNNFQNDGWYRFNSEKDPCVWAAGRIFSYGDGSGIKGHPNWHYALFSDRFLTLVMQKLGFKNILKMKNSECRGYDHGWINLGIRAQK